MAKCKFCGETEVKKFYKSNFGSCKDCIKERVKQHRVENIEKIREYDRNRPNAEERVRKNSDRMQRYKTENPKKYKEYSDSKKKWAKENKDKRNAQNSLSRAVLRGKVKRLYKCEKCEESENIQGHHPDYNKPLEVIWLCPKCHGAEHKRLNEIKRKEDEI